MTSTVKPYSASHPTDIMLCYLWTAIACIVSSKNKLKKAVGMTSSVPQRPNLVVKITKLKEMNEETQAPNDLDTDDVANQGRSLLIEFICERMVRDGLNNVPATSDLQEPGQPCGPPMSKETFIELVSTLRYIGDDVTRRHSSTLQGLINGVPPDAERQTFYDVASQIFADGVFNWGRVVALFYFAYKVCVKALDRIPLIRAVINLIIDIIRDKVARWIIDRGGWEAIPEYFGPTWRQFAIVGGAGVAMAAGIYFVNRR